MKRFAKNLLKFQKSIIYPKPLRKFNISKLRFDQRNFTLQIDNLSIKNTHISSNVICLIYIGIMIHDSLEVEISVFHIEDPGSILCHDIFKTDSDLFFSSPSWDNILSFAFY